MKSYTNSDVSHLSDPQVRILAALVLHSDENITILTLQKYARTIKYPSQTIHSLEKKGFLKKDPRRFWIYVTDAGIQEYYRIPLFERAKIEKELRSKQEKL